MPGRYSTLRDRETAQGIVQNSFDQLLIGDSCPQRRGDETGVVRNAGVGVDLEDPGVTLRIDAKIDADVSAAPANSSIGPRGW